MEKRNIIIITRVKTDDAEEKLIDEFTHYWKFNAGDQFVHIGPILSTFNRNNPVKYNIVIFNGARLCDVSLDAIKDENRLFEGIFDRIDKILTEQRYYNPDQVSDCFLIYHFSPGEKAFFERPW